jgi:hypothetical protein
MGIPSIKAWAWRHSRLEQYCGRLRLLLGFETFLLAVFVGIRRCFCFVAVNELKSGVAPSVTLSSLMVWRVCRLSCC